MAKSQLMVSPPPVLDMVISVFLPDISEVPQAEATYQAEPVKMGPHTETSVGMFCIFLDVLFIVKLDIGW
jgi:hypothetical protein